MMIQFRLRECSGCSEPTHISDGMYSDVVAHIYTILSGLSDKHCRGRINTEGEILSSSTPFAIPSVLLRHIARKSTSLVQILGLI